MASKESGRVLADVAELKGGFAFKSKDYADHGRFVLRTVNIADDGSITHEGATYIPEELAVEYSRFELEPDDTLFVMVGATLGKVGYVREKDLPALLNQNMWVVRTRDREVTHPRFLHYWFREKVKDTLGWASGSARGFVRRDDYRNLSFSCGEYPEQQAIAHILGTLDDKIELNRQMNHMLEAMARGIFKAWFVDFEPVEAKAAGATSFRGMPQAVFDQLPDSFTETELGPVPEGWEVSPLSDVVELIGGGTPKRKVAEYWDGDIPWFSVRDAPNETDAWVIGTEEKITQEGVRNSSAKVMPAGTSIISARGTVGRLALTAVPMAMNQSCYGVTGRDEFGDFFVYFTLHNAVAELQKRSHGSVFDTITRQTFDGLRQVQPQPELLAAFEEVVSAYLIKMRGNLFENRLLASIRDTLLPKLISGELRVSAAEAGSDGG